jgi:hypothetical protein
MEITPTTAKRPATLVLSACPPVAVGLGWLLLVTAPDGLDGLGQILLGMAVGFLASIASLPALVISIRAVRSGGGNRGLATFAAVGNVLVALQTATILLSTAAYQLFW